MDGTNAVQLIKESKMNTKSLKITVANVARGNASGYTARDYAIVAANEIQRSLSDQGISSWDAAAPDAELSEATARREAKNQIAECDKFFQQLLGIEITEQEAAE
jgi:hypothetical protein